MSFGASKSTRLKSIPKICHGYICLTIHCRSSFRILCSPYSDLPMVVTSILVNTFDICRIVKVSLNWGRVNDIQNIWAIVCCYWYQIFEEKKHQYWFLVTWCFVQRHIFYAFFMKRKSSPKSKLMQSRGRNGTTGDYNYMYMWYLWLFSGIRVTWHVTRWRIWNTFSIYKAGREPTQFLVMCCMSC
jgi:hypothetical protein